MPHNGSVINNANIAPIIPILLIFVTCNPVINANIVIIPFVNPKVSPLIY